MWVWEEREVFYQALENLPQVFCHRDVFGRNLIDQQGETVLIDWAYAGIGALGEELTPLVQATYLWHEVGKEAYKELEEGVLYGYLEGLRQAGWQGDAKWVRLGYAASSALRYTTGSIRFG
jgi:aminoglycoside/choline kinase family phosphotransferase